MELIDVDGFFDKQANPKLACYVLLSKDELPYIEAEDYWLRYTDFGFPIYLLRCSNDDFRVLDIGKHPKVSFFVGNKEIVTQNGMPDRSLFNILAKKAKHIYEKRSRNC